MPFIQQHCTVHDEVYTIQHYAIKFVSARLGVSPVTPVSSTNKTERHDITEILLKVALSIINETNRIVTKISYQLIHNMVSLY